MKDLYKRNLLVLRVDTITQTVIVHLQCDFIVPFLDSAGPESAGALAFNDKEPEAKSKTATMITKIKSPRNQSGCIAHAYGRPDKRTGNKLWSGSRE